MQLFLLGLNQYRIVGSIWYHAVSSTGTWEWGLKTEENVGTWNRSHVRVVSKEEALLPSRQLDHLQSHYTASITHLSLSLSLTHIHFPFPYCALYLLLNRSPFMSLNLQLPLHWSACFGGPFLGPTCFVD